MPPGDSGPVSPTENAPPTVPEHIAIADSGHTLTTPESSEWPKYPKYTDYFANMWM